MQFKAEQKGSGAEKPCRRRRMRKRKSSPVVKRAFFFRKPSFWRWYKQILSYKTPEGRASFDWRWKRPLDRSFVPAHLCRRTEANSPPGPRIYPCELFAYNHLNVFDASFSDSDDGAIIRVSDVSISPDLLTFPITKNRIQSIVN